MDYLVVLIKSDEGYSVQCPTLPGCWSQGNNVEEAIENIKDAIRDYLETGNELNIKVETRVVQVNL